MTSRILFSLAGLFIVIALSLAILPATRFGYHGDGKQCGQYQTTLYHPSITSYLLFTQPLSDNDISRIGTCPYEEYYAKTYAIELWVLAGVMVFIGKRKTNSAKNINKSSMN